MGNTYYTTYPNKLNDYNTNYGTAVSDIGYVIEKLYTIEGIFKKATGEDIVKIDSDLLDLISRLKDIRDKVEAAKKKTNTRQSNCEKVYNLAREKVDKELTSISTYGSEGKREKHTPISGGVTIQTDGTILKSIQYKVEYLDEEKNSKTITKKYVANKTQMLAGILDWRKVYD